MDFDADSVLAALLEHATVLRREIAVKFADKDADNYEWVIDQISASAIIVGELRTWLLSKVPPKDEKTTGATNTLQHVIRQVVNYIDAMYKRHFNVRARDHALSSLALKEHMSAVKKIKYSEEGRALLNEDLRRAKFAERHSLRFSIGETCSARTCSSSRTAPTSRTPRSQTGGARCTLRGS